MVTATRWAAGDIVRRLAAICGARFARSAGAADDVAGTPARWVAAPATAMGLTEVLRVAAEHDLSLIARGAGTKFDWGSSPSRADIVVDIGRLAGVWHQPPGELVAEVGAGTPIRAVQAVLARHGRRLPLDPPSAGATIGGVVAADEAGPLRHRYGIPGDQMLGVTYVDADGHLIRSDASTADGGAARRLLSGSQGALGVLVSATLRVQPAPASRLWVSRSVWTPLEAHDLVQAVLAGPVGPSAVEIDLPVSRAAAVPRQQGPSGPQGAGTLTVLVEGGPSEVRERAAQLISLTGGDARAEGDPPPWWRRYPFGPDDVALRIEVPIPHVHAAIYALRDAAGVAVPVRGSVGVGVIHAALPGTLPPGRIDAILAAVRGVLLARGGTCVVMAAPAPVRDAVDLWGALPGLPVLRTVKERFDPQRRLAPGRFVGGI
ncbi:FAD-binding oxidoreductase [Micromonospora sp. NPDC049679]|uniref:FAD-binding oxidoreductase n=1 Tax=Micromonospora sp. NPDC049679 TaxID=3155920 RepID=UPI0033C89296